MNIKAAGILLERPDRRILLLHRRPEVPEGGKWGILGGKNILGRDTIDTALLKTRQETGLLLDRSTLTLLDNFTYQVGEDKIDFTVYIARVDHSHAERIVLNPAGHVTYIWIHPEDVVLRDDLMRGLYPILDTFTHRSSKSQ